MVERLMVSNSLSSPEFVKLVENNADVVVQSASMHSQCLRKHRIRDLKHQILARAFHWHSILLTSKLFACRGPKPCQGGRRPWKSDVFETMSGPPTLQQRPFTMTPNQQIFGFNHKCSQFSRHRNSHNTLAAYTTTDASVSHCRRARTHRRDLSTPTTLF